MLELRDISFFRGTRPILEGVSVSLHPGRVTALLGPNGAGKSTLLALMSGELTTRTGAIILDGRTLDQHDSAILARRRAVLPQESHLTFAFSVGEVVMMGRMPHLRGSETPRDRDICAQALARLGVDGLAQRLYTTLSAGEKQRVHLARVLAQIWEPVSEGVRLLFLDEPTACLDPAHQHSVLSEAAAWAREGAVVLAVLHDLNLALAYADDAWILDQSHLVAAGPITQVVNPEIVKRVFHVSAETVPIPGRSKPFLYIHPQG